MQDTQLMSHVTLAAYLTECQIKGIPGKMSLMPQSHNNILSGLDIY